MNELKKQKEKGNETPKRRQRVMEYGGVVGSEEANGLFFT